MNQTTAVPMTDAEARVILLAYLTEHGPTRNKTLAKNAGTPYERSMRVMKALAASGEAQQVPGGFHRGVPTLAWCIAGDPRAKTASSTKTLTTAPVTYAAHETLAAMQAAARMALLAGRGYTGSVHA